MAKSLAKKPARKTAKAARKPARKTTPKPSDAAAAIRRLDAAFMKAANAKDTGGLVAAFYAHRTDRRAPSLRDPGGGLLAGPGLGRR